MNEKNLAQKLSEYFGNKIQGMTYDDNFLIIGIDHKLIRIEDYPKKNSERIISEILQQLEEANEV